MNQYSRNIHKIIFKKDKIKIINRYQIIVGRIFFIITSFMAVLIIIMAYSMQQNISESEIVCSRKNNETPTHCLILKHNTSSGDITTIFKSDVSSIGIKQVNAARGYMDRIIFTDTSGQVIDTPIHNIPYRQYKKLEKLINQYNHDKNKITTPTAIYVKPYAHLSKIATFFLPTVFIIGLLAVSVFFWFVIKSIFLTRGNVVFYKEFNQLLYLNELLALRDIKKININYRSACIDFILNTRKISIKINNVLDAENLKNTLIKWQTENENSKPKNGRIHKNNKYKFIFRSGKIFLIDGRHMIMGWCFLFLSITIFCLLFLLSLIISHRYHINYDQEFYCTGAYHNNPAHCTIFLYNNITQKEEKIYDDSVIKINISNGERITKTGQLILSNANHQSVKVPSYNLSDSDYQRIAALIHGNKSNNAYVVNIGFKTKLNNWAGYLQARNILWLFTPYCFIIICIAHLLFLRLLKNGSILFNKKDNELLYAKESFPLSTLKSIHIHDDLSRMDFVLDTPFDCTIHAQLVDITDAKLIKAKLERWLGRML